MLHLRRSALNRWSHDAARALLADQRSRDQAHPADIAAELRAAYLSNERAASRGSMMTDEEVRARLGWR
jgi:hypothetical protein